MLEKHLTCFQIVLASYLLTDVAPSYLISFSIVYVTNGNGTDIANVVTSSSIHENENTENRSLRLN